MKKFKEKPTGLLTSSDLKTVKGKLIYWAFFIIVMVICVVSVVPALWTVLTAFKDTQEIYKSFTFFPENMSFGGMISRITESWKALQFGESIFNTIILSLGNLVSHLIVCGFGGYVLSRLKPRGSKLVFALVVWTMMMPSQIRMVPTYISYLHFPFAADIGGINLLDTYWPFWLGAGSDTFAVLLFKNAFDALSISYVESAKLDGCSNYGVFFRIMLPLSMPIIIYQSIVVLSGVWSDFFGPLLVLDKNVVLPLQIYRMKGDTSIEMNTYFMGLVFASMPPLIIFTVFQKHILGGINVGGVKG